MTSFAWELGQLENNLGWRLRLRAKLEAGCAAHWHTGALFNFESLNVKCWPGGWRGLHMAKTRVTFGRGPDVMAGAGTGHRSARMSHWEGAPPTLRSGPVGGSAFFP